MKKYPVLMSLIFLSSLAVAQPGKTPVKTPVKAPVKPVAPVLKTSNDSISYVLGEVAAFRLIEAGFGDVKINNTAFLRAMNDIYGKKQTLINDVTANTLLNNYMMKQQEAKAKVEIEAGKKFLDENKTKPGVTTTPSGLQYLVMTQGTGIRPAAADTFVVHYRGTLLNGTEFDASYNRGQPLVMAVSDVVPGWIEALQLMNVGSKYKLFVPYNLGYGLRGNGAIPPGATLVFEMELLDVKKKAQ